MANTAYVKLVSKSNKQVITLDELKDIFVYYQTITKKTGTQLDWSYGDAAFPYIITEPPEAEGKWFYLKGIEDRYKYIVFGVDGNQNDNEDDTSSKSYIQVVLPEGSTHGDKGKANEFVKFLGRKLEAEVELFNGRTMYYYKR
ncbi:DUF1885 family protein [Bacillus alkalicellulosilyticus]|uniref:DUF1885 family protein n=1 Tax=Alkalihalobacterium alkalicellulosilyticum TaxID=1912214 RepID=UPI0009976E6F|nr:DUF1885 family protein [Bacillus alkalicellulosilyticus]